MNKEFLPYQESLELKKLGFDEDCFKYCLMGVGVIGQHKESSYLILPVRNSQLGITGYTQPLFQQALRWFREKYGLYHSIGLDNSLETDINCDYQIINHSQSISEYKSNFKSYEQAELECIRKLIKITKENDKTS